VTGRQLFFSCAIISLLAVGAALQIAQTQTEDVVLYASQASVKVGSWTVVSDSTAAGGFKLSNPDAGAAKILTPQASPSSYFELNFYAQSGRAYRLWIRGRAQGDSSYNDSVYAQFSGSVTSGGSAVYRIGTTSAADVNLEDCFGCGLQGWGWQDNGWGVAALGPQLYFQTTGTQTIRIQTREDGLSIDQVVLSPTTYLINSPGGLRNDTVILPASAPAPPPTPTPTPGPVPASNVVIWASNVAVSSVYGYWVKEFNSTAAGQVALRHPDYGAAKLSAPMASPNHYFETSFNAEAGRPYRLWIRSRATNDSWANDSVFVQFSGSLNTAGAAAYRIGTSSALEVNLEDCSGCGLQGWGWQDNGWGIGVLGPVIYFQTTGTQTLRVQTREDGLSIDQIVLSPSTYLNSSPGSLRNDTVILQSTVTPPPLNQPPQCSIFPSVTSGNSPLPVTFYASAYDPDGSVVSYNWNLGNGTTSSVFNPTVTYQSPGNYTVTLTVTDNAGATATAAVSINVTSPTPPPTTAQLRVLSWNIAFGKGTDGLTNYDRTATWIANINPDLVALSEMPPDKISTLIGLLNQKTGRSWYSHFVAKYPNCPEGNLIVSKYSFASVGSRYLSYNRSVAQVTVTVGGRTINFFATHLDHESSSVRYTQVGELMSWTSGFAESRVVAGDFNAGPDTSEIVRMASSYYDSWVEAMARGTAVGYPDNPVWMHTRTRRGRIDDVFYSRGTSSLVLKGTQVPDNRDLNNTNVVVTLGTLDDRGVRPSDHNMMIANFEVR